MNNNNNDKYHYDGDSAPAAGDDDGRDLPGETELTEEVLNTQFYDKIEEYKTL